MNDESKATSILEERKSVFKLVFIVETVFHDKFITSQKKICFLSLKQIYLCTDVCTKTYFVAISKRFVPRVY